MSIVMILFPFINLSLQDSCIGISKGKETRHDSPIRSVAYKFNILEIILSWFCLGSLSIGWGLQWVTK